MIIENVDFFKQWLVEKLEPICDAEPTALAKYICALVRKDKPELELKALCNEQLDVFLQSKTKSFVDDLFTGLSTKDYNSDIPATIATATKPAGNAPLKSSCIPVIKHSLDSARKSSHEHAMPVPSSSAAPTTNIISSLLRTASHSAIINTHHGTTRPLNVRHEMPSSTRYSSGAPVVQSVPLGGEPAVKRAKRSDGSSINIDRSQVSGYLRPDRDEHFGSSSVRLGHDWRMASSNSRDGRDDRDNRDNRTLVDLKEIPDSRGDREIRSLRECREGRSLRENCDIREARDPRDRRDMRDSRDIRDQREHRHTREHRDMKDIRDGGQNVNRDGRDERDTKVAHDRCDVSRRDNNDRREASTRRRRSRSKSLSPRRGREAEDRRRRYEARDHGRHSPERRHSLEQRHYHATRSRSPHRHRTPEQKLWSPNHSDKDVRNKDIKEKPGGRSRSWSRPKSSSPPKDFSDHDSRGSTPTQDNGQYPAVETLGIVKGVVASGCDSVNRERVSPDEPSCAVSLIESVVAPCSSWTRSPVDLSPGAGAALHNHDSAASQHAIRCPNFDEKGFCMLGDLCPYDHGMDPVVVEDIGIPNVIPFRHQQPSGHQSMHHPATMSRGIALPHLHPRFPPPNIMNIPPPRNIIRPSMASFAGIRPALAEPFQSEGYNPEAPGITKMAVNQAYWMTGPSRLDRCRFPVPREVFHAPPPPVVRQNLLPILPSLMMDAETLDQRINKEPPLIPTAPSRVVIPAMCPGGGTATIGRSGTLAVQRPQLNSRHGFQSHGPRATFNFNRLGGQTRQPYRQKGSTALEVRKIPPDSNTITRLNDHFSQFGSLTNIEVRYELDSSAALISFSTHDQALRAYHSSQPVFNNRFIKVFWHRPISKQPTGEGSADTALLDPGSDIKQDVHSRLGPRDEGQPASSTTCDNNDELVVEAESGVGNKGSQGVLAPPFPQHPSIPPPHKLSLCNVSRASSTLFDQSIVYTTSMGTLKKTVFSKKAAKVRDALASPTAVKSAEYVSRIEAMKKSESMKREALTQKAVVEKLKETLLHKYIAERKELLDKLAREKDTMTPEDKAEVMKTLKAVMDKIDMLKYSSARTDTHQAAYTRAAATPEPTRLVGSGATMQAMKKDILDTELDLITRQGTDQDTSQLRHRLLELTQQASSMGVLGQGQGRAFGLSRGAGRHWPGRGDGFLGRGSMTLDKRTKSLEIRGFQLQDIELVKSHFALCGAILQAEVREQIPCVTITFETRRQAELAMASAQRFVKSSLSVRWYMGLVQVSSHMLSSSVGVPVNSDDRDRVEQPEVVQETLELRDQPKDETGVVEVDSGDGAATVNAAVPDGQLKDIDERILLVPEEEWDEEDETEIASWRR